MRIQLFLVVFVLTSTCSTVANADTCTNCKVWWARVMVLVKIVVTTVIFQSCRHW